MLSTESKHKGITRVVLSIVFCVVKMVFLGISLLLVTFGNRVTYGAAPKSGLDPSPISFPGPVKGVLASRFGDVPDECKSKNYCTVKPPDYPQDKFNKIFKGTKIAPQPSLVVDESPPNRQGDPDEIDDCETEVSYEPLYKVKSRRGWHTVVQAPEENYVQRVRIETCKNPGGRCFTAFPPLAEFKTFCKQKYSQWEFLVDDSNGGTEKIETELPICCSCNYKIIL